jgi:phage tail-like protein
MNAETDILDRYWFLDQVAGWREAFREHFALTKSDGYLRLDALPGAASLLIDASTQTAEFTCPSALSADGCGNLLVVDATKNVVKHINLARGSVETLPSIGEEGADPRSLHGPRGIATLHFGGLVVADTGNHHVKLFSAPPYALLQDWGANDASGLPAPGDAEKTFRWPWAVAANDRGTCYVIDRGNRQVQEIACDGESLPPIGADLFVDPTRLALGPDNVLAVVDPGQAAVFVFSLGNRKPWSVCPTKKGPRSVTFDGDGTLYVGDAIGRIHVFRPDSDAPGNYSLIGVGDTGVSGDIVDLAWDRSQGLLLAIIRENFNGQRQRLWKIDPTAACVHEGRFITETLDSKLERCQWHRVILNITVPDGASVEVDSFSSDEPPSDAELTNPKFNQWRLCILAGENNPERLTKSEPGLYVRRTRKTVPRVDCLVQSGPGQYLRLRFTFKSNGRESPELRWIKVFYPRVSYLQYLPPVYQEDEESRLFLERFLSIFQSEFDEFDRRIDHLWQLFDPDSVPQEYLHWLAGWLALVVNPEWQEGKLRSMLKGAFDAYLRRGTVVALEQVIEDYTSVPAKVLEHFRMRRWPALSIAAPLDGTTPLWSRDFYKRLQLTPYSQVGYFRLTSRPEPLVEPLDWGAHQFTVFFPADPYRVEEIERKVLRVVEREKPAHTQATLCPVLPRLRVGVQATIGVDSVVGGMSYLVLNLLSTLGYDSVLACSPHEINLRALGSVPRSRAGLTTKLS